MKKSINEFIGTFFLVLTVGLALANAGILAPLAIGSILMVMVYAGGHISGAHYNPAVTRGMFLSGKITFITALSYRISQFIGGIAGAGVSYLILGSTTIVVPGTGVESFITILCELIMTFALVRVVLNVAASKSTSGNSYFGLAIGFTVMVGALAVGKVSGAAFNPAVAVGHQLMDMTMGIAGNNALTYTPLYFAGNFGGAALAAIIFKLVSKSNVT